MKEGFIMNKSVIIIGGGIAGMSAAIRLAGAGYHVTILEQGERLGGKLNIRQGNGFSFDTGPSILTMPWVLEQLFQSVNRNIHDYIDIVRVEPGWRTFYEDGTVIDLNGDLPTMLSELRKINEEDADNFFQYLDYCQTMYNLSMKSFYAKSLNGLTDLRQLHTLKELMQMDPMRSMSEATTKHFKSTHLQQLFNFLTMYIGSSPYHTPAILSQLTHVQLGIGVYYVKGGMYKIAKAMMKVLEQLHVDIHLNTKVGKLVRKGNVIEGVQTVDGKVFHADLVISNLEAIPCYETLLKDEIKSAKEIKQLEKYEPTVSGFVMLLGLNKEYKQLAHHNFFFSQDPKKEFKQIFDEKKMADDPTIYIGISSKSDNSQAPEGKENFFILTHVPPLKDGENWEIYRNKYREVIFNKLERMGLEDIREHIEFQYEFIPNDLQQLYGANGGSIYGVVTDRKLNGGFKIPNQSNLFKNLYFVGGSTHPGGGVPMVCLSGQLTANLILSQQTKQKRNIG